MKRLIQLGWLCLFTSLLSACGNDETLPLTMETEIADGDYERGPNNGRLLVDGDFAVELAIFETGVPPEYRAWATAGDEQIAPNDVDLQVTLTRLGDVQDRINFFVESDYLRGDQVIYEPHSFLVSVTANHQGSRHAWEFDSFEGRTSISPAMVAAFGIETATAGPALISQNLDVIGQTVAHQEFSRQISARFNGFVTAVYVSVGERIKEGQRLLTIESDSSLTPYTISSPIDGYVSQRIANPGEQTNSRVLLEILDTSQVWAELSIHLSQRNQVAEGMPVKISSPISEATVSGVIDSFNLSVRPNQSIIARVLIDNKINAFAPGTFIEGSIETGEIEVPLAVKRTGLQPFRDFTVVFAQIGDTYEVRMLDLGRQDGEWIEVLGGLNPGTTYVTTNSYILKADVEKSGASHDH
ncbi:MAG: efflux RND transporter periplasmic adaptor subunit [Proteobacteria bacterium]|nr:efflux RND transporter periplasmic adaptor subunit [Pseudomonadota bacterium]